MTVQHCAERELDAWIAEHVMGWKGPIHWADDGEGDDPYLYPPNDPRAEASRLAGDRNFDCIVPFFSTDIAAAWQVVEAMLSRGFDLDIKMQPGWNDIVRVAPRFEFNTPNVVNDDSETVPLGICHNSRKAIERVGPCGWPVESPAWKEWMEKYRQGTQPV